VSPAHEEDGRAAILPVMGMLKAALMLMLGLLVLAASERRAFDHPRGAGRAAHRAGSVAVPSM
jgi:hypothetical protein